MTLPLLRRSTQEKIGEIEFGEDWKIIELTGNDEALSALRGVKLMISRVEESWMPELQTTGVFSAHEPASQSHSLGDAVFAWNYELANWDLYVPRPSKMHLYQ